MNARILIADDEASLRCLLQATLQSPELQVVQAMCGSDVLRLTAEQRFDMIILDWMMPGMTGIEVLERLRKEPKTASVPVLMLTARGQIKDQQRAMALGATDYVLKPFSPLELLEKITTILEKNAPAAPAGDSAMSAEEGF
jgi:two-component system phosphate regulon response regulator PhoB